MTLGNLREEGAVLLVSCYELGHQPLGLALPAAFLERAGFHPACLDVATQALDLKMIRRAGFVGISAPMHTALRLGLRAALIVRDANPDCHICFFGLYAILNAGYLLDRVADSIIGGEYEQPLTDLICGLHEGKADGIEGVAARGKPAPPFLRRLSFPIPARSALPALDKYACLETSEGRLTAGYVEASRGCRHFCLHCPIPPVYAGRFFVVPMETVIGDIRRLAGLGARHITFGDPDFLNGPTHSLRIVKAMHEENPGLTFDFTAKVEHLVRRRDLLDEFARCGCLFIVTAAESLSDTVLRHLEKGHTRADFFEALKTVRNSGIRLRPTFVSFTPWTTLEDYLEILSVAEAEDLLDSIDPIQYAVRLLVPPGSRLLKRRDIERYLGPLELENFYYNWTHPDQRMDRLHQDVAALVEKSMSEREDPLLTYLRIRELAESVHEGREMDPRRLSPPPYVSRPLRLTEPWFC